jgi:hypothetical protein
VNEANEIMTPEILAPSAVEAGVRAEFDVAINTAKRYPRSLQQFLQRAEGMATIRPEIAASCEYALPQGGQKVKGPSVRLAEIVAATYGNLRIGARIIEETGTYVVAQGIAHDLETNVAHTSDVRRRIVTKEGKRYSDDMVIKTMNAACAIASRNATFKVVPMALIQPVIDAAKKVALGSAQTLPQRREAAFAWFKEKGVAKERIFSALGVKGVEDIGLEQLADLNGMWNAAKDGEMSLDEMFPSPQATAQRFNKPAETATADAKAKA